MNLDLKVTNDVLAEILYSDFLLFLYVVNEQPCHYFINSFKMFKTLGYKPIEGMSLKLLNHKF